GTNGDVPSSLMLASDGNFYGTTELGGSANDGVLFSVAPNGTYTALHEFSGGADGATPIAPPIEASHGNFYGTTTGVLDQMPPTVYKYQVGSKAFSTIYQ